MGTKTARSTAILLDRSRRRQFASASEAGPESRQTALLTSRTRIVASLLHNRRPAWRARRGTALVGPCVEATLRLEIRTQSTWQPVNGPFALDEPAHGIRESLDHRSRALRESRY